MKDVRYIVRDAYHAVDRPHRHGLSIAKLWHDFPELVVDRYLVNTSFDSGFLTLSDSEREAGWRMVGKLAHSPQIRSPKEIPHDQFDEWLVFDRPVEVQEFETLVNYVDFSPIDFDWEEKFEPYWKQILRLQPLHVIAENDGVYLLSKDEKLVAKILNSGIFSQHQ
jgi:hypothetical protein